MNKTLGKTFWYSIYFGQLLLLIGAWFTNRYDVLGAWGGDAIIAVGALLGLVGGYLLLMQLITMSGANYIERFFGLDRLSRWHHYQGLIGWFLILNHAGLIAFGYSVLLDQPIQEAYFGFVALLPAVILGSIALLILDVVVLTSITIVRKRLKYEYWYFVHLLTYTAIFLALFHQIQNGSEFIAYPWLKAYWLVLYALAFSLILWRRWFYPVYAELRFKLRVHEVVIESDDVTSIYITGENLEKLKYKAGQFGLWMFLQKGFIGSMHHPFSISSAPGEQYLRITVKGIGDFSKQLKALKRGTRVLFSGPYGIFNGETKEQPTRRLFIAGGIGITPIRSILASGVKGGDVLIYATRTASDAVFAKELSEMHNLKLVQIYSDTRSKKAYNGRLDARILKKEVPKLAKREVWLCGPPPMMKAIKKMLVDQGMSKKQTHTEEFRLG